MKKTIVLVLLCLVFLLFTSAFNQQMIPQIETEDMDLAAGGVFSISPCAMQLPTNFYYHKDYWVFYRDAVEFYFPAQADSELSAWAPVNLPNGAVVKKFVIYCTDNDDTADTYMTVHLARYRHTVSDYNSMASVTTLPLAASPDRRILKDEIIDYAQVKNHMYSYILFLEVDQLSDNVRFHGAKIIYE